MDMSKISKIDETDHLPAANRRLEEGWILLAVGSANVQEGNVNKHFFVYSLGFPGRPELG